jgi:putative FmdB family regulatory protein
MPTYQYECTQCGHQFEAKQSIKDDPLKACPKCRGAVERVVTGGSGFILKGAGFYKNDYRRDPFKPRCGQEAPCCGRDAPCEKPDCDA